MPVNGANTPAGSSGGANRTTFRPPWVKDGPQPMPLQTVPWRKSTPAARADTTEANVEPAEPPPAATPKKRLSITITPKSNVNGQQREVAAKLQSREIKVPIVTERVKPAPVPLKPRESVSSQSSTESESSVEEAPKPKPKVEIKQKVVKKENELETIKLKPVLKKIVKSDEQFKEEPIERKPLKEVLPAEKTIEKTVEKKPIKEQPVVKKETTTTAAPPPPPPPAPPGPPPPPPPPSQGSDSNQSIAKKSISNKQKNIIEKLKTRPRRRPDWSEMMKEVESGRKLRHVDCNDRSKPILTCKSMAKVQGQFIYETEKANAHNVLLKQIQGGIKLKSVRTNDRSKPILEGLRKFRRQMTIEEQIMKSESRANLNVEAPPSSDEEEDDVDDIDKLRDDLQSTKQLLSMELRNKEAEQRENKRLLAKIQNLEVELEQLKIANGDSSGGGSTVVLGADDTLVKFLKDEAAESQKASKLLEKKYQETADQLDTAKGEIEEQKRQLAALEKKVAQQAQFSAEYDQPSTQNYCYRRQQSPLAQNSKYFWETDTEEGTPQHSISSQISRRPSEGVQKESSPEPELDVSESDSEDDEETKAERKTRRLKREVAMLVTKLKKVKEKEFAAKRERKNLKDAMKKNQSALKQEFKKYKVLQREVEKMAAMMKEEQSDDEHDGSASEEEEEEPAEESSEESESEESESEDEESQSESDDEDASDEDRKADLEQRIKRHEGMLAALKKGNYLLQTNVDRLQDEINKTREKSITLQADLDSVLSELG